MTVAEATQRIAELEDVITKLISYIRQDSSGITSAHATELTDSLEIS
jgi:hypothetical protein